MNIYKFKVKNYTTILIGQTELNKSNEMIFYIQRADGFKYKYEEYMVEWYERIS